MDSEKHPADTRTLQQKAVLRLLLNDLMRQFSNTHIVGHRDLNPQKARPSFEAVKEYA